jgi:hypothetical protein
VNRHYPRVADRADHRCEYCHAPESIFNFAFEIDHINPRAKGGRTDLDNLALACKSCNNFKSDSVGADDEASGTSTSLFNPRRDRWDDHFIFDPETNSIRAMTATGKATIDELRLNSAFQLRARWRWVEIEEYP